MNSFDDLNMFDQASYFSEYLEALMDFVNLESVEGGITPDEVRKIEEELDRITHVVSLLNRRIEAVKPEFVGEELRVSMASYEDYKY